ncbi:hypothetical protein H0H81_006917 [Sphagnurus paluster]|uniref:Uncharacterized protein n=1 Tax=Sphagnurus paluster TaxID=117069 RepID=A0A9P7FRH1_9AGAR|nr:hypothetical protein H0H81_006917 [Sphagnurus paluster]
MPAGGSPQPMSADPDGSTPTRVRETVPQQPHRALPARSSGLALPKHPLYIKYSPIRWLTLKSSLRGASEGFKYNDPVGKVIAANTNSADLQDLYKSLKLLTAAVVEVARIQDIILAPPQAAPPPPNTELAQVLSAVQALSQKVTKLEIAASKAPPPPKPATKPPPAPSL